MRKKLNESTMQRYKLLLEYSIREGQAPTGDSYYGSDKRVELQEEDPAPETAQGYTKKGAEAGAAPEAGTEAPAAPQSPADAMIPDMDAVDVPVDAPATGEEISMDGNPKDSLNGEGAAEATAGPDESREDILSQLIQLHSDKLKSLEEFAASMNAKASSIESVVHVMPEVQAQIGQLAAQVEELTPDTPLQAMANVPKDLGGTTPEDWWNSYWADKNQNKQLSSSPYYPQQKGDQRQPIDGTAGAGPDGTPKDGGNATYYMKASDLPDLSVDQAKNSFLPKQSY